MRLFPLLTARAASLVCMDWSQHLVVMAHVPPNGRGQHEPNSAGTLQYRLCIFSSFPTMVCWRSNIRASFTLLQQIKHVLSSHMKAVITCTSYKDSKVDCGVGWDCHTLAGERLPACCAICPGDLRLYLGVPQFVALRHCQGVPSPGVKYWNF